jgi:hypothetical protein
METVLWKEVNPLPCASISVNIFHKNCDYSISTRPISTKLGMLTLLYLIQLLTKLEAMCVLAPVVIARHIFSHEKCLVKHPEKLYI